MLGKLIKHEFKATGKIFGLLFAATIVLALLSTFCVYIPFDNFVVDIITGILTIASIICIFGGFIFSLVIMVRRFYNNMLKDEGYLMHTLPVKQWQHLTSKLVTDFIWFLASIFISLFSVFLIYIGTEQDLEEIIKGLNAFIDVVNDYPRLIGYIIGICIILILQFFVSMLGVFAAMSLGQLFSKHKIFGTVLFYFVLNYITGAVLSAAMALYPGFVSRMNNLDARLQKADTFEKYMDILDGTVLQIFLVLLVAEIVIGAFYFLLTNYMMSKKLNLE